MKPKIFTILFAAIALSVAGGGCGYGFQNSKNPLYLKEGVQKIYIDPVVNNTYKAGVENVVYNNLVRALTSYGKVILVRNQSEADAVLRGTVLSAAFSISGGTQAPGLNPTGFATLQNLPTKDFVISTEYSAVLTCSFALTRKDTAPGKKALIWTSSFSRSKPFPAANQLDVPGTTSALINESEFDRALSDLSRSMMDDVHESMLAMF